MDFSLVLKVLTLGLLAMVYIVSCAPAPSTKASYNEIATVTSSTTEVAPKLQTFPVIATSPDLLVSVTRTKRQNNRRRRRRRRRRRMRRRRRKNGGGGGGNDSEEEDDEDDDGSEEEADGSSYDFSNIGSGFNNIGNPIDVGVDNSRFSYAQAGGGYPGFGFYRPFAPFRRFGLFGGSPFLTVGKSFGFAFGR